jgi:hypothetical protein
MGIFDKTLTIKDLLDIDQGRIDRSKNLVNIKLVKQFNIIREEPAKVWNIIKFLKKKTVKNFYTVFDYKILSDSGKKYAIFIKVAPSFKYSNFLKNKVQVACNCEDFKFRAVYELNKFQNLYRTPKLDYHFGIALTTAPTKVVTTPICKHVFLAIDQFKKDFPNLKLVR